MLRAIPAGRPLLFVEQQDTLLLAAPWSRLCSASFGVTPFPCPTTFKIYLGQRHSQPTCPREWVSGPVGLGLLWPWAHLTPVARSWVLPQPCWHQTTTAHLPPGHTHPVHKMHAKDLSSPSLIPEFIAEERISLFYKTYRWNTSKLLAFTSI